MAKLSPLQIVKRDFGSKEKLVDKLAGSIIERIEGEGDDDFRQRLLSISNKKLLRLNAVSTRVSSDFGGKEGLVDAIVGMKFTKPNADYKTKLMTFKITRLVDLHDSLKKNA